MGDGLRRPTWTAVGKSDDLVKDHQGILHRKHHVDRKEWRDQRKRYFPKFLPTVRPIEVGRLVQCLRDSLEPARYRIVL